MDLQAIKQAAATYGPAMTKFLREIVAFLVKVQKKKNMFNALKKK